MGACCGERPGGARPRRACRSCWCGVVLISGVLEDGAYGDDPAQGVLFGVADRRSAYAGFILAASAPAGRACAAPRARCSTRRSVAAIACVLGGGARRRGVDLVPPWPRRTAWLVVLALTSQVLGWLLISRLAAAPARRPDLGAAHACSRSARSCSAILIFAEDADRRFSSSASRRSSRASSPSQGRGGPPQTAPPRSRTRPPRVRPPRQPPLPPQWPERPRSCGCAGR